MLEQVLRNIRNFFVKEVYKGEFTIADGNLQVDFLANGQYFKIEGSVLNDGVYAYPAETLVPEVFSGEVWAMAVPPAVIALSAEIDDWVAKNADALASPYSSESFGGYSYSRAGRNANSGGGSSVIGWADAFKSRLDEWRKI